MHLDSSGQTDKPIVIWFDYPQIWQISWYATSDTILILQPSRARAITTHRSTNNHYHYQDKTMSHTQQGKSEGFESCDWPIVQKHPIWVKIGDVLYRVTLKFDGWPWKTIGHLSFAVSSFVQHFIAIGEFKLELQSGNAQFGSNSTIFRAVWPWNLTDDLEKR